ncbi:MAG: hypothetical protein U5K37_05550 [Natrialbaceae archaeon]|nr:hypothetical protein [Natrialbaceae archaeon]
MSVGLSLILFFSMNERQRGIFVGLWPPTILSFAGYLSLRRMERKVETVTSPG